MIVIVACLSSEGMDALLRCSPMRSVKTFSNLDSVEDVCDQLWDSDGQADCVITDSKEFDQKDLLASAQNRPLTRFIVIGSVPENLLSVANVRCIPTLDSLEEALSVDPQS